MNSNTPGPWTIKSGAPWIIEANGRSLAFVYQADSEDNANARLIAAAPDLLAALKRVVNEVVDDSPDMWQQAADAIAKAEGRE